MDCGASLVKYLVFLFNLIFAISGVVLLVIGVLFRTKSAEIIEPLESTALGVAPILVIIVGAVIFVIAFFGCCGAIRESSCMLTTYGIILLVLFILQVAIGVFAYLQIKDEDQFKSLVRNGLQTTFNKYNTDPTAKEEFDLIQYTVHCCGVNSFLDWGLNVPPSCCKDKNPQCSPLSLDLYRKGCTEKVFVTVTDNVKNIAIVVIALSATELIAAIFSFCLSSSIRSDRRRHFA